MLDNFFIYGALPANLEKGGYQPSLVILSYALATISAYVAISLSEMMAGDQESIRTKHLIHWFGSCALGSGIWSMHFIGMLSYHMRMKLEYDPVLTFVSLLIAIAVAYRVLQIVCRKQLSIPQLFLGAIVLGFGICGMHYTGMAAMHMDANLRYRPDIFLLSVIVAISASGAALWIIFHLVRHSSKYHHLFQALAAMVMGFAIAGMHYTGMAAAVFIPYAQCRYDPEQNFETLVMVVTVISTFILASTLMLAISNQKISVPAAGSSAAFPARLLGVSVFLTLVVLMWMGGNSFYIHYFLTHTMARNQMLAETADEILYQDGVLSQSMRSISHTGDESFDKRYYEALEIDLDKRMAALPDEDLKKIAVSLDHASDEMALLEKKSQSLMEQMKIKEAKQVIQGVDYAKWNQLHLDDRRKLSERIRQASHENLQNLENNIYITLFLVSGVILIICVTWYFAYGSIRRWRIELENTRANLTQRITEKEKMEKQLNDYVQNLELAQQETALTRWELELILSTMQEGIYRTDTKGNTIFINRAALEMTGYNKEEIIGAQTHPLIHHTKPDGSIYPTEECHIYEAFIKGTTQTVEDEVFWHKDGHSFPVSYTATPARNKLGGITGAVIVFRDITEQQKHERELYQAMEAAEAANIAKSEFLANMSHELRTPMHSIITFSRQGIERISRWSLDDHQENLQLIHDSGNRLLLLLNDLLDLSKLEAGATQYQMRQHHIKTIIDITLRQINSLVSDKNLHIECHIADNVPLIECDDAKIIQVMVNLMSNAIKFTAKDRGITINVTEDKKNAAQLLVTVADQGVGIPEDELEQVFDKFVQSSKTKTGAGGTGLGLAICKEIINAHGGRIWAENNPQGGAIFSVLLPVSQQHLIREKHHG